MAKLFNNTTVRDVTNGRLSPMSPDHLGNASLRLPDLHDDSPLKVFGQAKKKLSDLFDQLHEHLLQADEFLQNDTAAQMSGNQEQRVHVQNFAERTRNIREILARRHMKVAFFGRTSNGKSTVVNALLQKRVLPCGMGHTTSCFLQVQGGDSAEPYFALDGDDADRTRRSDFQDIELLANALHTQNLGDDTLCHIYWPKNACALLRDDVVLVDSPGIDVTPNLDGWIDKHCIDADVFVLVVNGESTLMQAEKSFFHKVSARVSKPNIFILNNRWDVVAEEPESAQVRKQHTERSVAFLAEELKLNRAEALERVFFVSAKEVLALRLQGKQAAERSLREGHQQRYFEFEDFERRFEQCLSRSALHTKFAHHSKCGREMAADLAGALESINRISVDERAVKQRLKDDLEQQLQFILQQIGMFTKEVKHLISGIVEQVENKVSLALNEEIKRLSLLINDFDQTFNDDKVMLQAYKGRLHTHVESGLEANLRARLNTTLQSCVDNARESMLDRVLTILPATLDLQAQDLRAAAQFTVFYQLNCKSLCADFQESLEFRFSYGICNLFKTFKAGRAWLMGGRPTGSESGSLLDGARDSDVLTMLEKFSPLAAQSQTTMGGLAIGGFLVKAVGVRVLVVTVGVYSLVYVYERITWTNRKKEKVFKKQYVRHATEKLRLIVDLTSANCSHQIKQ
jgi:mitofusin